ncbi:MAG: hypothetical protein PHF00_07370, partial [Elusimicrobia bacterium]|nr:hypothetical protein [Elusimicrobiota bacterium]
ALDRPQIACASLGPYPDIMHVKWNGAAWLVSSPAPSWVYLTNAPSMVLDSTGSAHISFDEYHAISQHSVWIGEWQPVLTLPTGKPSIPTSVEFSSTSILAFAWTSGSVMTPDSNVVGYYLQIGTDPSTNNASFFDGDVGNVYSSAVAGGIEAKTYYARVRARNGQGDYTDYSDWSSGTTIDLTAPGVPTSASAPSHPDHDTGYPIIDPNFTLSGPSDASGIAGYHWRIDGNAATIPTSADSFSGSPIQTHPSLADGTWYFHAVARDNAGNVGTAAIHYKFVVQAAVNPAIDNTLIAADGTRVEVPSGALENPTSIDIQTITQAPAAPNDPHFALTSIIRDISMVDGTSQFNRALGITLAYTPADIAGMNENDLRLFYYDQAKGYWILVSDSTVDTLNRRVSGHVGHLTMFGIAGFAPAATAVESLTNYPNPFSPLRGQQTHIRYALDQDRNVQVRIYDPFGRLVWQATYGAGTNGGRQGPNEIQWDGRTGSGRTAEMGGYICVVDSGGKRETVKIGVK